MNIVSRFVAGVVLFAAGASSYAFDYRCDGITVGRAIDEIAKLANLKIKAGTSSRNEVVWIDVHDVTAEDLCNKIREATGLSWIPNWQGLVLDDWVESRMSLDDENGRVADVRLARPATTAFPVQGRPVGFDYGTIVKQTYTPQDPDSDPNLINPNVTLKDTIGRILATVEGRQLVGKVRLNSREVFSNWNSLHTKKLPASIQAIVRDAMAAYKSLLIGALKLARSGQVPNVKGMYDEASINNALAERPTYVNLVVYRTTDAYYFQMQLLGPDGKWLLSYDSPGVVPDPYKPLVGHAPVWQDVPATTDPVVREYATAVATFDPRVARLDPSFQHILNDDKPRPYPSLLSSGLCSPAVREIMLNPAKTDPLSVVATPFMKSLRTGKNFVAVLPDDVAGPMAASLVKGDSAKFMSTVSSVTTYDTGNWTIVRPVSRWDSIDTRTPREPLFKFLESMEKNYGLAWIGARVNYAANSPRGLSYSSLDFSLAFWLFERDAAQVLGALHGDGWYDYRVLSTVDFSKLDFLKDDEVSSVAREMIDVGATVIAGNNLYFNVHRSPTVKFVATFDEQTIPEGVPFDGLTQKRAKTLFDPLTASVNTWQVSNNLDLAAAEGLAKSIIEVKNATIEDPATAGPEILPTERVWLRPLGFGERNKVSVTRKSSYSILAYDSHLGRKVVYSPTGFAGLRVVSNYGGNEHFPMSADTFTDYVTVVTHRYTVTLHQNVWASNPSQLGPPVLQFEIEGQQPVGVPGPYSKVIQEFQDKTNQAIPIINEEYRKRINQKSTPKVPPPASPQGE